MTNAQALHHHLLRPAVIHILRANGFASARPSIVDTITDLAARYTQLLAMRTAYHVFDRTLAAVDDEQFADLDTVLVSPTDLVPTITDIRLGLTDAAFFTSTMTASEEAWAEALRRPLDEYPTGAGDKERTRRDNEDTRDVKDFVDWAQGSNARECRRIAGLLNEQHAPVDLVSVPGTGPLSNGMPALVPSIPAVAPTLEKQDYLVVLKKKQGKHSDEARYAGTLLGKEAEDTRSHRIEGGPHTVGDWRKVLKRKRAPTAT